MRLSIILLLCAAPVLAAPPTKTVDVVAAPPIATAPDAGLDPDVAARLDAAERAVAAATRAELDALIDRVLIVYESDDPFSQAQRDAARPRSLALLKAIGERARAMGELTIAARAFDARWTLAGGQRDHELAQVLTTWAERDAQAAPARALYLARRARSADPSASRAAELDDDLSRNHRVWPGRLAIIAGIVALVAGVYARNQVGAIESDLAAQARPGADVERMLGERDRYDALGTGLLVAAPVLSIGGMLFIWSGKPSYAPTSPAELPAMGTP